MHILHLAAGAGDMLCGACHRDLTLIRELQRRGHQVTVVPLYTPLRHDRDLPTVTPLFYGGVACWLEQHGLTRLPGFAARLLASRPVMAVVGRYAARTRASEVGPLAVSMLEGRDGRQAIEMERLLAWLATQPKPEVISLTNALISGLAPALRERLGVPVICAFQGEDDFVDHLGEPWTERAWKLLARNAAQVTRFTAPSQRLADDMIRRLGLAADHVRLVPAGLDAETYPLRPLPAGPPTIGYLGVITPRKGLDVALDALRQLGNSEARLLVAGQILDPAWVSSLQRDLRRTAIADRVTWLGEVDWAGKLDFFARCHVVVMPSRFNEARGMVAMEAMASGVPVVVPDCGIFPELLAGGGGLLVPPDDPTALAQGLASLLADPVQAATLGQAGATSIRQHHSAAVTADAFLAACA